MSDVEELMELFRIGRMGRDELEREIDRLDLLGDRRIRPIDEMAAEAQAIVNVQSVEAMLDRSARARRAEPDRGGRRATLSIDMERYEADKRYLDDIAEEDARRKRLIEAARGRLRHFEKRDGYLYRPETLTPLEAYIRALEAYR